MSKLAEKIRHEISKRNFPSKQHMKDVTMISPPLMKRILAGETDHIMSTRIKLKEFCSEVDNMDFTEPKSTTNNKGGGLTKEQMHEIANKPWVPNTPRTVAEATGDTSGNSNVAM